MWSDAPYLLGPDQASRLFFFNWYVRAFEQVCLACDLLMTCDFQYTIAEINFTCFFQFQFFPRVVLQKVIAPAFKDGDLQFSLRCRKKKKKDALHKWREVTIALQFQPLIVRAFLCRTKSFHDEFSSQWARNCIASQLIFSRRCRISILSYVWFENIATRYCLHAVLTMQYQLQLSRMLRSPVSKHCIVNLNTREVWIWRKCDTIH